MRSGPRAGRLLAIFLLLAAGCGSSPTATPALACAQSLSDYCARPGSVCVQHIQLSTSDVATEASFCTQCGAKCSGQSYAGEDCQDGTLKIETQVGMASPSK